jgi:hypothetical protein
MDVGIDFLLRLFVSAMRTEREGVLPPSRRCKENSYRATTRVFSDTMSGT